MSNYYRRVGLDFRSHNTGWLRTVELFFKIYSFHFSDFFLSSLKLLFHHTRSCAAETRIVIRHKYLLKCRALKTMSILYLKIFIIIKQTVAGKPFMRSLKLMFFVFLLLRCLLPKYWIAIKWKLVSIFRLKTKQSILYLRNLLNSAHWEY